MSLAFSMVISDFVAPGIMMIGVLESRFPLWFPDPVLPELTTGPPPDGRLGGGIIVVPAKIQVGDCHF
jgi:hypothetical protein